MQEVVKLQEENPDHILLVQVGGFYEIYDQGNYLDEMASLLHLKIMRPGEHNRAVGFPLAKIKGYLESLIRHGKTVAVAEQTDKDYVNKTKHHVRTVTRIFTPGTVIEDEFIESKDNNFLLCVSAPPPSLAADDGKGPLGLAWLDVSTGEFVVGSATEESFEEHLARIQPKEILLDKAMQTTHATLVASLKKRSTGLHLTFRDPDHHAESRFNSLVSQTDAAFFQKTLARYDVLQKQAAGNLLAYANNSIRSGTSLFAIPAAFSPESVMGIDAVTQTALEISQTFRDRARKGTLLNEVDETKTAAGSRLLASRLKAPSTSITEINRRLDLVNIFYEDTHLLADVRATLTRVKDLERAIQKIHIGKGTPGDYMSIIATLRAAVEIAARVESKIEMMERTKLGISALKDLHHRLEASASLLEACDAIFNEGMQDLQGISEVDAIREGVSNDIDSQRKRFRQLMERQRVLEAECTKKYSIPEKPVVGVMDPKVGHYLAIYDAKKDVRDPMKAKIGKDGHCELFDRASVTTTVQFTHRKWTALSAEIAHATEELVKAQTRVFTEACHIVKKHALQIVHTAKAIAETDVAAGSATYALQHGCVRPIVTESLTHDIKGARHPVVETSQANRDAQYVHNDYTIGENTSRVYLVTGPNMGGKSTFLRMSALMSVIAQTGLYVPAQSATIGIVDKLFARVGASDDLAAHKSTFMVEMQETAAILNNATRRSFVIMDEIGRGTSSNDGLAIAYATLKHIHDTIGCRTVFATHYHELAHRITADGSLPATTCVQTAVIKTPPAEELIYTYRIEPGIVDCSHGIPCAVGAGMPPAVIEDAKGFYRRLEVENGIKQRLWETYLATLEPELPGMRAAAAKGVEIELPGMRAAAREVIVGGSFG
ncbi:muts domain V-domain-containing protein [Fimicolochytrium jonesii]|uniref:muts domain V-domain-containing protein n=1 Tax=Fimicolochytrium jonesii TaxID=1396493 RepID=UPI0022FEFE8A|nr:muts domain V-domain-containing protein [Fimicolochytrium jonesii]KAI8815718.1 muts domain V-domain-containing protein [Fimicolochytrium jonesii]